MREQEFRVSQREGSTAGGQIFVDSSLVIRSISSLDERRPSDAAVSWSFSFVLFTLTLVHFTNQLQVN